MLVVVSVYGVLFRGRDSRADVAPSNTVRCCCSVLGVILIGVRIIFSFFLSCANHPSLELTLDVSYVTFFSWPAGHGTLREKGPNTESGWRALIWRIYFCLIFIHLVDLKV